MLKKSMLLVSIVVLLSFVLGACAPAAAPAEEAPAAEEAAAEEAPAEEAASTEPIRIGMGAIMTGSDTYIHGELITNAALLAAEEINAAGGVLGRPLEIVILDDAGDPKQAVTVAHSFCDDESVVAVMVDPYSGMAFAAMPVYDECGMPMINHGSNPRITEEGYPYAIQTNPNDLITGFAAADYVNEVVGAKKVAVMHNKSMFGKGVADVFMMRCEELGMEITSYQGVDPEDVDFTPVLTKIKEEDPDVVYFAGYVETALIKNQMTQLGMDQVFVAAEATSTEYIEQTKDNGVGTISATGAPPLDFRPEIAEFDAKFFEKYGNHPESWAPYYYDRVYAYADIITKAGEATREAIKEKLFDVDVPSIVYPKGLQVDEGGRAKNPVTFVYEMQPDYTFKLVYLWEGTPPYTSMSKEEYDALIDSLR